MSGEALRDVCVVTQPLSAAGERISLNLLDVISAITSVSLMTGSVPPESPLRDEYEIIEISEAGTGMNILVAAVRFLINQIRMGRKIWDREEEMILFFGPTAYLIPVLVAKLAGKTVVLQPRGDVPLTLRLQWEQHVPTPVARVLAGSVWILERIGLRISDAIIAYTPAMAEELELGVYESKLQTSGARYIDTDRFQPTRPLEKRERIVGFLGRIDEEKGVRTLANVAELLPEDITFVFAGDGQLSDWLDVELAAQREAGNVEITGWVDNEEVPDLLNRLQLLVMPSQPTEGLPTVILESFACGTPVYATPVAGVPDVVRDGETGFWMEGTDAEEISEDIINILSDDTLRNISKNCRYVVEQNYSYDAAVRRYRQILSEIN
jgi:glycosyltransferase involved in cell wall biosynthesis